MDEADALQEEESRDTGRQAYSSGQGVAYKASYHVFINSVLTVDLTYRKATATLPLSRSKSPDGKDAFYILTGLLNSENPGFTHLPLPAKNAPVTRGCQKMGALSAADTMNVEIGAHAYLRCTRKERLRQRDWIRAKSLQT